ncbi:MAG: hypothetical protein R3316_00710 [Rhodovibrionaceae bacterium]|nr:hypothetical protein [Rhodovibrionaceae bacterium]
MSFHEYLLIFFALVVALVVGEFLTGWRDIYRHRDKITMSWLLIAWSFTAFLLMLESAWGLWLQRGGVSEDSGRYYFTLIAIPIFFHVLTMLLFPRIGKGGTPDLPTHFERNREAIFLLGMAILAVYMVEDLLLRGAGLWDRQNLYRLLGIFLLLVGISSGRPRVLWPLWSIVTLAVVIFIFDVRVELRDID